MKIPFDSVTPRLLNKRKAVHEVCRQFSRSPSKGNLKRLKERFAFCGDNVFIEYGFHMDYGDCIRIGARTYINTQCTFIDGTHVDSVKGTDIASEHIDESSAITKYITIGNDCFIGPNVQFLAVSHALERNARLEKRNYVDDIKIGNNVWIGGGVTVLGGVFIGDNSVIGAGSVVTKKVNANSFYAGNPAIKIRDL